MAEKVRTAGSTPRSPCRGRGSGRTKRSSSATSPHSSSARSPGSRASELSPPEMRPSRASSSRPLSTPPRSRRTRATAGRQSAQRPFASAASATDSPAPKIWKWFCPPSPAVAGPRSYWQTWRSESPQKCATSSRTSGAARASPPAGLGSSRNLCSRALSGAARTDGRRGGASGASTETSRRQSPSSSRSPAASTVGPAMAAPRTRVPPSLPRSMTVSFPRSSLTRQWSAETLGSSSLSAAAGPEPTRTPAGSPSAEPFGSPSGPSTLRTSFVAMAAARLRPPRPRAPTSSPRLGSRLIRGCRPTSGARAENRCAAG